MIKSDHFLFNLYSVVRYRSVMTQEDFKYLANETRTKAVSAAEKFGYSEYDAEDIAQDVMLRLWSLHEQFTNAAHLKASATITARHLCIDRWRTSHQHQEIDNAIPIADEDTFHDRLEYTELEQWLAEQIDHLPSTSATVLKMRQLEHREVDEIAEILGIRPKSVSTLLSRARNELLNKLKRRNQR